jgi:hypothetical protein
VSGIANSLVALCELRAGTGRDVIGALEALGEPPSPFARVTGTHFARWAYVGQPPLPTGRPAAPGPEYLLMCADHDPPLPVWAHALCEQGREAVESVMRYCVDWPGADAPAIVAEFLAVRNARPGFTVNTYRPTTVADIRAALSLRRSLRSLAVDGPGLSPAELRKRWREAAVRPKADPS